MGEPYKATGELFRPVFYRIFRAQHCPLRNPSGFCDEVNGNYIPLHSISVQTIQIMTILFPS